jgi:excisionase family DNA binding protein
MNERYLDVNEACEFLKMGRTKLYKLKKEGRIPYIKIDRSIYFDKNDLIEFMESHKRVDKK